MAEVAVECSGWERALMAAEKVKQRLIRATGALDAAGYPLPDIGESQRAVALQVTTLEALVQMKLTAWRDKDRTHLRDLIA